MQGHLAGWRSRARRLLVASSIVISVGAALGLAIWLLLRASLPQLDGSTRVSGAISHTATLQRDALGVLSIQASSRTDLAYATGFAHAQERFFQMDLMRRTASGELADLIGASGLPKDRSHRPFGFRHLARPALAALSPEQHAVLRSYADGVNAGLGALQARPWEYLMLRHEPRPWADEDSLLVIWSMYLELQGQMLPRELARDWLGTRSSAVELTALLPSSGSFDTAIDSTPINGHALAPLGHAPSWLAPLAEARASAQMPAMPLPVGSNAWAVAGTAAGGATGTAGTGAMLQNDMHLPLRLPNTWFRLSITYPHDGAPVRVSGLSLPGVPAIVVGSNGHVAWGFTNAYVESLRLVPLEVASDDPHRVKTPGGWEPVRARSETLSVSGTPAETMVIEETSLGPLRRVGDRTYAIQWVARAPDAVNLSLIDLEGAANAKAALAVAARSGIPAQNFIVADKEGQIGWTIAGALADPAGTGPMTRLDSSRYPQALNPASGRIVSANNRQLADDETQRLLGDGGADMGARARHIADSLSALSRATEKDMLDIALDDRALYLQRWKNRLDRLLDEAALEHHPRRAELKQLLQTAWRARAAPEDASYRVVRAFMHTMYTQVFGSLDKQLAEIDPRASYAIANPRWPETLERLVDEQPAGWWPKGHSWRDAQLGAVDQAMKNIAGESGALAAATWGSRNTAEIRHPFAALLPGPLARMLSAPADPLPGDDNMPRVSAPSFGQSMRLVVSPSHEERATLDMPGGQSGHPLSPYFLSTHQAWQRGEPRPLLPGPVEHTLTLVAP